MPIRWCGIMSVLLFSNASNGREVVFVYLLLALLALFSARLHCFNHRYRSIIRLLSSLRWREG